MVVIRTHYDFMDFFNYDSIPHNLFIIDRYDLQIKQLTERMNSEESVKTAVM